jgi:hypothetical protein
VQGMEGSRVQETKCSRVPRTEGSLGQPRAARHHDDDDKISLAKGVHYHQSQ